MPHEEESPISIVELHTTFAAEVRGVDFNNLTPEILAEVQKAITKVSQAV